MLASEFWFWPAEVFCDHVIVAQKHPETLSKSPKQVHPTGASLSVVSAMVYGVGQKRPILLLCVRYVELELIFYSYTDWPVSQDTLCPAAPVLLLWILHSSSKH